MTTIKLRQRGDLLHTTDSDRGPFDDPVDRIMHGIKNSLGPLSTADAARVRRILAAHSGGCGFTPDAEFNRGNRQAQRERIEGIAKRNADFWDKAAASGEAWG